ncbi:MAG: N-acetyltransferase [Herpetosiphon sp.]
MSELIDARIPRTAERNPAFVIRRASVEDVEQMAELINGYATQGLMLPKTLAQLYNNVRDFLVAVDGNEVVGCAGLKVTWRDLSEVVSLAVAPAAQGQGLGRRLVVPLLEEARTLRIPTVFSLTYQVKFFEKLGFIVVPKTVLSQKVWQDCQFCPKQQCCDEVAMTCSIDLGAS